MPLKRFVYCSCRLSALPSGPRRFCVPTAHPIPIIKAPLTRTLFELRLLYPRADLKLPEVVRNEISGMPTRLAVQASGFKVRGGVYGDLGDVGFRGRKGVGTAEHARHQNLETLSTLQEVRLIGAAVQFARRWSPGVGKQ